MNLVKQDLAMQQEKMIDLYNKDGFVHLKDFFNKDEISKILNEAKTVFYNQFVRLGITKLNFEDLTTQDFDMLLYEFFVKDLKSFTNTGKQVQHLMSLHSLSLKDKVVEALYEIDLENPVISTRPVMFFNHEKLSKERVYYSVDAHQDWRSMQGSLNYV